MTSSIPYTVPLNTPNIMQTPSSLVDSSLVSYIVLLISNSFKYCLFFTRWLSMTLVIIGLILHMFGYFINTYGSYLNSIHHSYFYTRQFSPVVHSFPKLALYPHGVTEAISIAVPYYDIYDISEFYHPHIIYGKVLHQTE